MALRDRPFDRDTNLAVVGPLTAEALERIAGNFVTWALSDDSRPFRYRRAGDGGSWRRVRQGELEARARASVRRVAGVPDLAAVEALVRAHEYEHFGVELFVTDDSAVVSFSHRFSDGLTAVPSLRAILSGEPAAPRPVRPFPLLRALRATGQLSWSAVLAGRAFLREKDWGIERAAAIDPAQEATDATVGVVQAEIANAELSRLVQQERATLPAGERLAPAEVIAALALRSLRRCLTEGRDLPIVMTSGLRRFLPEGVDAKGSFVGISTVGTLRSSPWSARDVRDDALPRARDPRLVPAVVVHDIAAVRARLRSFGRRPTENRVSLVLNLLHGSLGVRPEDVVPGTELRPALLLVHRGQSNGAHCTIEANRTHHVITVFDDSGVLDLTAFPAAFDAECREIDTPR